MEPAVVVIGQTLRHNAGELLPGFGFHEQIARFAFEAAEEAFHQGLLLAPRRLYESFCRSFSSWAILPRWQTLSRFRGGAYPPPVCSGLRVGDGRRFEEPSGGFSRDTELRSATQALTACTMFAKQLGRWLQSKRTSISR
jgi:hypothetical protein